MEKKLLWVTAVIYCQATCITFATRISLPALDCSEDAVIGSNVGVRPYREGGIRLEKQNCDDKAIFHNYGHGGTGVTLAPACVDHTVSSFLKEDPERKAVSVLGSSVMGLLTADRLADEGFQVTIYAKQFPEKDYFYKKGKTCITSQAGGGLWFPFGVDKGHDKAFFKSLQRNSFTYYKTSAESKNPRGVSFRNAYSFPARDLTEYPEELELPKPVEVEFGNQKYFPASQWSTIHIDNNIFIHDVYESLKGKGVTFKEKDFSVVDDVLAIPDTYIFNCTGYGARYLFNDVAMKPIRGQMAYLKPQPNFDFFLFTKARSGASVGIYPSADKISIGLTYEKDVEALEVVPAMLEEMRQNVVTFFKDKVV